MAARPYHFHVLIYCRSSENCVGDNECSLAVFCLYDAQVFLYGLVYPKYAGSLRKVHLCKLTDNFLRSTPDYSSV